MTGEEESTCQPSPCVITGGAVSGEVPTTEAFAIHYPGYPSSCSRAIQTLGGIDQISQVRADANARLSLRFRPEDPYSHPAFGDHRISNCLLLKLSKSRRAAHEELRGEIVARVVSSYQFEGMVDYQYVVPVHAAVDYGSRKRSYEVGPTQCNIKKRGLLDSDEGEIMMLVPQLFSLKDIPQRVVLKPPANLFSRNMQIGVVQQSWEMQIETCMAIDFNIEKIPVKIDWQAHIPKGTDEWKCQMAMSDLFDERPIWPRWSLEECLFENGVEVNRELFKRLFLRVGYYFSSGPFGKFWIRKGYDPRKDPESRIFQIVNFRIPPSLKYVAAGDKVEGYEHKWKDICRFQVFPSKRSVFLQLYELEDDYVQQEIRKPTSKDRCTHSTGWFSTDMLTALLLRVKIRFLSIYPNGGADALLKATNLSFEKAQTREALRRCQIAEKEKGTNNSSELPLNDLNVDHGNEYESEPSDQEAGNNDESGTNERDEAEDGQYESPFMAGAEDVISPNTGFDQLGADTTNGFLQDLLSGFQYGEDDNENQSAGLFEDPDGCDDEFQIYEQNSDEDSCFDDDA